MPGSEREQQFLEAEHLVELRSGELKKELRLPATSSCPKCSTSRGCKWIGTAGKLRDIPSGIVVVHLNREMPLEGGYINGPSCVSAIWPGSLLRECAGRHGEAVVPSFRSPRRSPGDLRWPK
jgi:hypothetical protein